MVWGDTFIATVAVEVDMMVVLFLTVFNFSTLSFGIRLIG